MMSILEGCEPLGLAEDVGLGPRRSAAWRPPTIWRSCMYGIPQPMRQLAIRPWFLTLTGHPSA
jgi:hypothetical protein